MKRRRPQLRTLLQIGTIVAGVFGVLAIVLAMNYRDIRTVVDSSLQARQSLLGVQADVAQMHLLDAKAKVLSAQADLDRALSAHQRIQELRWIPFAARQLAGVRILLVSTDAATDAVERVIDLGADLEEITGTSAFAGFSDLTAEQKHDALKRISESVPDLIAAKAQIGLAIQTLEHLPRFGLLPQFKLATVPLKEQLPKISDSIAEVIPYAKAMPAILGYPTEHRMLLLLQNNTELRPTGGFIGTYGVVTVKDATLQSMETENVYALDRRVDPKDRPASPPPLVTYLNPHWFFRDANWDPDFPTSAKTLLQFYREEGGVGDFQSVLAITPQVIVSLLELVGDVTVDGKTFTPENVVATLEYEVEQGYAKDGVADIDRKDIVGKLASALIERVFKLPKEQVSELTNIFLNNAQEKHLLVYFQDPELQQWARGKGWTGEVRQTAGDALLVVDANMASLKTDAVMERSVDYRVKLGETPTAELSIRYKNNGEFRWDQTRYRTYTRVYVPKGSRLLSSSGAMTNDRTKRGQSTDATVTEEESRTVFHAFISIEPGEEGILKFQYALPATISERWRNGEYHLLIQKQSGTLGHPLTVQVESDKKILEASPNDAVKSLDNGQRILFESELSVDRELYLSF